MGSQGAEQLIDAILIDQPPWPESRMEGGLDRQTEGIQYKYIFIIQFDELLVSLITCCRNGITRILWYCSVS